MSASAKNILLRISCSFIISTSPGHACTPHACTCESLLCLKCAILAPPHSPTCNTDSAPSPFQTRSVFAINKNYINPSGDWKNASYVICAGCIGVSNIYLLLYPQRCFTA